uniref:Endoplasmic reticulum lectin 1 n=2 Tax=Acrobeloides nanus TaxID=290746 RepID=A0A914CDK8_9BILA
MIRQFLFLFITPLVLGYLKPKATFPNRPECLKSSNGLIDSTQEIYFPDSWSNYNPNNWGYSQQNTTWLKELKFLRYAQDMIDNGTLILNNDCQVSFWDYKCPHMLNVMMRVKTIQGQGIRTITILRGCKSLEKPNTETGNRIPLKSENFGLDCYIRKMFDQPIPNHILSRWEPLLAKCANKVMQLSEHMFQQSQFDRVLTSACEKAVNYYSYQLCGSNSFSDEDSYLMCWLKNKNANFKLRCIDVVNSRISLIARNEKLLNRRFLFSQCKSELDFYDCAPNNSNLYIQPIDMLTCLVDGYYNYSKKKSVPNLFGSIDFVDDTKVDVMFKSSCQLEMRSSANWFFQEPRLTPNLMMDCAQVLNKCYKLGLQKDTEIVHCLMYMAGANEKFNDQTKICVETLNKIAKINQVGIQPGFDGRVAADCKAFSNECKDPSCIRLNTYDKYDPIKQEYISYPKNYSDPCTQRTIERLFYTLQNLPEDLIDGRLAKCSNENDIYLNMFPIVPKENLTRKIDEYNGPNPFELLLPFYNLSTGYCNNHIFYTLSPYQSPYLNGALDFCPGRSNHITLNPNLQIEKLQLNGKNFDKYKPSYKVKNGIAQPYLTVNYINGSICKATGLPRTTKVLNFCMSDYSTMVNEPCETSPCNYEIEVYTYHLCKHPALLPYLLKTTPSTPIPSTPQPTLEIYEKEKEITWKRNPFTDTPKETTALPYWTRYRATSARDSWRYYTQRTKDWRNNWYASTPEPVYYRSTWDSWRYYTQRTQDWLNNWYASTPEPVYYRSNSEFEIPPWVGYLVFGVVMWVLGFASQKYMCRNKDRVLWPRAEGYNKISTITT